MNVKKNIPNRNITPDQDGLLLVITWDQRLRLFKFFVLKPGTGQLGYRSKLANWNCISHINAQYNFQN